jgi:AAA domain/Primase C terminal 2 (PriCT-2)
MYRFGHNCKPDHFTGHAEQLEARYGTLDAWMKANGYSREKPPPESDIGTRPLFLTIFKNEQAAEMFKGEHTLPEWQDHIRTANAPTKGKLFLLKGAFFGDKRSEKNCLRTDENLLHLTAIVVEHDKGTVSFDQAMSIVSKAGLRTLAYTSPSYREDNQRWRLIFPLSRDNHNPKTRHEYLVACVNGIFDGKIGDDSWSLSRAYYFGSVDNNPAHRVEIVDGQFLDLRDDLYAGRKYKDGSKDAPTPHERTTGWNNREPIDTEIAQAALDNITSDCKYDDWWVIGAALWNTLGDEGETLFVEWSKKCPKRYNEKQVAEKWEVLKTDNNDHGAAKLFWRASQENPNWSEEFRARQREQDHEETEEPESAKTKKPAIEMFWHGTEYNRELRPWLINKLIPQTGTGLASGQWGSGKTFVMFDLAGSIITGLPFAGRNVSRRGGVMFVAAEGGSEITIRLEGLVEHKLAGDAMAAKVSGNAIEADLNALPFVWIEECPSLKSKAGLKQLTEMVASATTQLKEKFDLDLVLIVIDTLSAAADFTDQNDAAEGQAVMNTFASLSRATGAFVMAVDHFGKDATVGTRGTSAKEASADVVLAVLADKDVNGTISNMRMAVRKLRGGKTGDETPFELEVVEIGDEDETTCTVKWASTRAGSTTSKRIPKGLKIFHNAVTNAIAEHGVEMRPFGNDGPLVRAVTEPKLRDEFVASYPADNLDAKTKAFRRALKEAREQNLICSRTVAGVDQIWLVQRAKKSE